MPAVLVYMATVNNNNNNNNNTQLLSCHVSTDTVKTVGVESQARRTAVSSLAVT